MFLKKVCIFLAIAFLAVDIFLVSIYIQANNNLKMLSDNMVDNTVRYYESIGIIIDENIISRRVPDNKIYTFMLNNSIMGSSAAEKLSKSIEGSAVSVVEIPDGHIYSISSNETVAASLRVYMDTFEFEYNYGDFTVENSGVAKDPFINSGTIVDGVTQKALDNFVSAMFQTAKPFYKVQGSYSTGSGMCISIAQKLDDKTIIDGMYMNVVVDDGRVVYAKGNIIFSPFTKSYSEQLYDGVNALGKVDSSRVKKFVSESVIYTYRYSGNNVYYLIPMWKIEYIDMNDTKQTQYVDAIKS